LFERHLAIDDDGIPVASIQTEQPSPTPTRPPTRVFGVGVGIFILWFVGLVSAFLWYDLFLLGRIYNPCCYNKPYNTCVCCLFWYGFVVLYLVVAPRESQAEEEFTDGEYAESYYNKYLVGLIMGCAVWYLGIAYCADHGSEELVFTPLDYDTEKRRNPAISRSSV